MRPVKLRGPVARGRCVGNAGINGNLRVGALLGSGKAAENVGAFEDGPETFVGGLTSVSEWQAGLRSTPKEMRCSLR
jgi:hypothetical protein